jgi:glycosyltransferase involved in cell wall biosynthesis
VSVVIPAYNAARTLDETLLSVRSQTHQSLDIVVVDDGSTDATASVAKAHAEADPRVRIIRQPNQGVAAARNTGWQAARSEYIGMIDSDDLWAPTFVEKLLAAMIAGGPKAGVAYCFFTHIDAESTAVIFPTPEPCEGEVLDKILVHNFTGCGSTILVRRAAFLATGGFDNSLRASGAQGCDDWLFCCLAAEQFRYVCVPEVLVGYRETPGSVSSSESRMLRSWMLSVQQLIARHPGKRDLILKGLQNYAQWLLGQATGRGHLNAARQILWQLWHRHPEMAARLTSRYLPSLSLHLARRAKYRAAMKLKGRKEEPVIRVPFPAGPLPPAQVSE